MTTIVSDRPIVGVGAVIVDGDCILLVKRGREPGKGLWAVPGGKVRLGETLREAVQREVLEETSLEVDVGDLVWAGEHLSDHGHIVLVDFAASVSSGIPVAADDADEVAWVARHDIDDYPLTPTMGDLIETIWP